MYLLLLVVVREWRMEASCSIAERIFAIKIFHCINLISPLVLALAFRRSHTHAICIFNAIHNFFHATKKFALAPFMNAAKEMENKYCNIHVMSHIRTMKFSLFCRIFKK
jgi:hypothetical protein